jgi:DNA-binding NarL/FixJ family response regulator
VVTRIGTAARDGDNPSMMAMTLLIVDDHTAFRAVARKLLARHGYEVVGEAGDGEAALAAVQELRPDVVLLDVQMPGIDGFEVAARLNAAGSPPAIVMVSSRDGEDFGGLIERSGARGFIPKHDLSGNALDAALA